MKEFEDRRELDNIYDGVRKNIKERIEAKGISMKGSAKGTALSEIISVFDEELEIGIAEELRNGVRSIRAYYRKYINVDALECDTEWSEYHDGFISYSQLEIDTAPSIDIVRCKECVNFVYDEQYKCYGCANYNGLMGEIKPDDFCSYGEREE